MKISSEDCYIEYKKGVYCLYIPKTKKEIKEEASLVPVEDSEEVSAEENVDPKYKIVGYYYDPLSIVSKIISIRKDKKYKLKQPYQELESDLKNIRLLKNILFYSTTFKFDYKKLFLEMFVIPKVQVDTSKSKHRKTEERLLKKSMLNLKQNMSIKNNILKKYESFYKK